MRLAMRSTLPRSLSAPVLLFAFVVAGCGGGGGGGGPTGPRLSGTLTIPQLGVGGGEQLDERGDDDWFHARAVGAMAVGRRLEGVVGAGDPRDVRRAELTPGRLALRFIADGRASLHLLESRTGRLAARVDAGSDRTLVVEAALELDLCVAADGAACSWSIEALPVADRTDVQDVLVLPVRANAPEQRNAVQAAWLGAGHPMAAGEVVVMQRTKTVPIEPGDLALAGLELQPLAPRGASDLGVHRVRSAESFVSVASGAPVEWSLEMETCLAALRAERLPGVRAASPNWLRFAVGGPAVPVTRPPLEPNDPYYRLQWHYAQLRMDQAWTETTGSASIVVAIIDTGIVSTHPEFSGRLVQGYDFISSAARARDGNGIDNDPEDAGDLSQPPNSSWHGTHVAGTIGARSNDGTGVAGVDWACKLMALRALGQGGGTSADILEAVKYAAGLSNASGTTPQAPAVPKGRADVVNMSLGGPSSSTVEEQVYADARAAGLFVICAAGNEATSAPGYPASYSTNLSVGAVRFDEQLAPYSNTGPTVDVVAPGGDLTVDQNGDSYGDGVLSCSVDVSRNPIYVFENGTSMACPHVAGIASLLLAVDSNFTPAQLETFLTTNVKDLGTAGRDNTFGFGLVDPVAALRDAGNSFPIGAVLRATPGGVNFGATNTSAEVSLFNDGTGVLTVDVANSTIGYTAGQPTGWLAATFVAAGGGGSITHDRLQLAVTRGVLPAGDYSAFVDIAATGATGKRVTVSMSVGTAANTDIIYVLLVDLDSLTTVFQTQTSAAQSFQYTMQSSSDSPIAVGSYLLVAGTDRDNDDLIGDESEIFGIWPNSDTPELVEIASDATNLTGLDFTLEPVQQLPAAFGRTGFRLLR